MNYNKQLKKQHSVQMKPSSTEAYETQQQLTLEWESCINCYLTI